MIASSCKFETLGDRESFNSSVRHVKATIDLAERLADGENLADALNALLDAKAVSSEEIQPFVSMLLVGKFSYTQVSRNLASVSGDLAAIVDEARKWNAVDLVTVYHHPDLGVVVLNPKNPAHASRLDRLNKYELLTVYAGGFAKGADPKLARKAAELLVTMYEGGKAKADPALAKGPFSYKVPREPKAQAEPRAARGPKPKAAAKGKAPKAAAAAPAAVAAAPAAPAKAAPPAGPKPGSRMTPMYAVLVTNELFHNGNVEAWKRIIESYKAKHPDLDVLVYYDSERITNLNALFKWGKVKHGSVIQFAIAGENICDVAKLQRYLAQGASNMFEAFLRGPVNGVLPLF